MTESVIYNSEEFDKTYLSSLNEQQCKAVYAVDGATLLLAVPGSGKTTVLVTRLGYMICCRGIPSDSILAITYTKAATLEMKRRYIEMFGRNTVKGLECRTINSLSLNIINYYAENFGKREPLQTIDEGERAGLIGQVYRQISGEYATESIIKDIGTSITYIKNMMLSDEDIDDSKWETEALPDIYRMYCKTLKGMSKMDFDDQMIYAWIILNKYPPVLEYFQERFRYICVDESQDTSKIQHCIIWLIAKKYGNIFMVGDEDQSIYGFRAAFPEALLNFEKDYKSAQVLNLENNYRSTVQITDAANLFVKKNKYRHPKVIMPTRGEGSPVGVIKVTNRKAQYRYLYCMAQSCETETAVLYRNNESAIPLIDIFERKGISYNCRQFDASFFTHRIINDITDIIRFVYDNSDTEIFMRIYNKLGCKFNRISAEYACDESKRSGKSIIEALLTYKELNDYAREHARNLFTLIPMVKEQKADTAISTIWNEFGYGQYVNANKLDSGKLNTLCLLGENEASAKELLRRLDELHESTKNHENSQNCNLWLSSIHSSKGLEYARVYMLDVVNGILPSNADYNKQSEDEVKLYEEERRIFYVGMTRAKDELYLFDCTGTKSAFNDEVIKKLPREIHDESDIMSPLTNDFVGMSYDHRDNGKGGVIAQCGFDFVVEYKNGITDSMTLTELISERRRTYVKAEQSSDNTADEVMCMDFVKKNESQSRHTAGKNDVGRYVNHKVFATGYIKSIYIENDKTMAVVQFHTPHGEKKLDIEYVLQNGIMKFCE